MAAFFLPTCVQVRPSTTTAWTDVDLSSYIPAGATGVVLHVINNYGFADYAINARKNGSTDNRTQAVEANTHRWLAVGVDSSSICEVYIEHATRCDVLLCGWFTGADAVFQTNATDVSCSSTGAWTDTSIASATGSQTAAGAFVEHVRSFAGTYGYRKNGSTDDRKIGSMHNWITVGVDASEIFETYIADTGQDAFLMGYLLPEFCSFPTNAVDQSTGTTGSYVDSADVAKGDAVAALLQLIDTVSSNQTVALRAKGSSDDYYYAIKEQAFGIVPTNTDQLVQQKISATSLDVWQVGYLKARRPTVMNNFQRVLAGGMSVGEVGGWT